MSSRPGEIEQQVRQHIDVLEQSRLQFAQGMVRIYEQLIGMLRPQNLQVAVPRVKSVGVITGDTPVVIASGLKVGTLEEVGIANAELRYLPVSRGMAVFLGTEPPVEEELALAPSVVQRLIT